MKSARNSCCHVSSSSTALLSSSMFVPSSGAASVIGVLCIDHEPAMYCGGMSVGSIAPLLVTMS